MPEPCRTLGCPRSRPRNRTVCHTCRGRANRPDPSKALRTAVDPENVETAVIRRVFPEGLTEAERRAVGVRLTRLGYSVAVITRLSGASTRTVWRWRALAVRQATANRTAA